MQDFILPNIINMECVFEWPACSSDLRPTGDEWFTVKNYYNHRSAEQLKTCIQQKWTDILCICVCWIKFQIFFISFYLKKNFPMYLKIGFIIPDRFPDLKLVWLYLKTEMIDC